MWKTSSEQQLFFWDFLPIFPITQCYTFTKTEFILEVKVLCCFRNLGLFFLWRSLSFSLWARALVMSNTWNTWYHFFLIRIHCKVTQFKSKCHAVQTKPDFLEISTFKSAFPKEHFSQWLSCLCLDAVPGGCPCITEEPGLGRAAPDQGVKCGNWSISLLWRYGMSEASSHRNFVLVQLKSIRKWQYFCTAVLWLYPCSWAI